MKVISVPPLLAPFFFCFNTAYADLAAPTGYYLGLQHGYNMMRTNYHNANFDTIDTKSDRGSHRTAGMLLEILAGGRKTLADSKWTVGFEVGLGLDTNNTKKRLIHRNIAGAQLVENQVKRQYFITPALTVGRHLCPHWHVFLKLGMPISRYKVRYNNLHYGAADVFRKTSTTLGFAPALGVEYALNQRFSIQGSVGWEWHQRVAHTLIPFDQGLPLSSYKGRAKVQNANIKLALLYKL